MLTPAVQVPNLHSMLFTEVVCWPVRSLGLAFCLLAALQVYNTPKFREMVKNCIYQDLSWSKPARKWEAILEEIVRGCPGAPAKKASVPTPVQAKQRVGV